MLVDSVYRNYFVKEADLWGGIKGLGGGAMKFMGRAMKGFNNGYTPGVTKPNLWNSVGALGNKIETAGNNLYQNNLQNIGNNWLTNTAHGVMQVGNAASKVIAPAIQPIMNKNMMVVMPAMGVAGAAINARSNAQVGIAQGAVSGTLDGYNNYKNYIQSNPWQAGVMGNFDKMPENNQQWSSQMMYDRFIDPAMQHWMGYRDPEKFVNNSFNPWRQSQGMGKVDPNTMGLPTNLPRIPEFNQSFMPEKQATSWLNAGKNLIGGAAKGLGNAITGVSNSLSKINVGNQASKMNAVGSQTGWGLGNRLQSWGQKALDSTAGASPWKKYVIGGALPAVAGYNGWFGTGGPEQIDPNTGQQIEKTVVDKLLNAANYSLPGMVGMHAGNAALNASGITNHNIPFTNVNFGRDIMGAPMQWGQKIQSGIGTGIQNYFGNRAYQQANKQFGDEMKGSFTNRLGVGLGSYIAPDWTGQAVRNQMVQGINAQNTGWTKRLGLIDPAMVGRQAAMYSPFFGAKDVGLKDPNGVPQDPMKKWFEQVNSQNPNGAQYPTSQQFYQQQPVVTQ